MTKHSRPYLTYSMALVIVAIFVLQLTDPTLVERYSTVPDEVPNDSIRFFTGAFLHANVPHLAMNLAALCVVGPIVERRLGMMSLLTIYAVSLVGGQAAILLWADPSTSTVGASGAIYGVFGAVLAIAAAKKRWSFLADSVLVLAVSVALSFLPGISWQAHLGGLLAGFVIALPRVFLAGALERRRTPR